jgi:predicted methyltransferase
VLASPTRSAEDKERDARDKPAEVLALAGFERGDTVADVFAGGGYYSEILAGIVGPEGQVLLATTPATTISARRAGPRGWRTIACRT